MYSSPNNQPMYGGSATPRLSQRFRIRANARILLHGCFVPCHLQRMSLDDLQTHFHVVY